MKNDKRKPALLFSFVIIFAVLFVKEIPAVNAANNDLAANAIYVAVGAKGEGTYENPMDFEEALLKVEKGQTIYMLEGTYSYANTITIKEDDNAKDLGAGYKTLSAYPGAKVVIDFSAQACVSSNRGIILDADYWYIYGITISGAGDNGMLLAGSNNVIEMCIFENNQDTGLQLSRNNSSDSIADWPSYNYILNCTSRNNHDPDGEDADGFAPKLTCGEGNVFNGCMAYNNVDDGWDCYAKTATGPIGKVTLINCIAFRNGQTEDGTFTVDSDGNGFKLGGSGVGTPHTVINCLAFENKNCGFVDNNNPTALTLINCTAFNNNLSGKKYNFNVYRCKDANCINLISYSNAGAKDTFQNTFADYVLYYNNNWFKVDSYMAFDSKSSSMRGEQVSTGLSAADFIATESPAIGTDFHTLWRNADGSLNTQGYAMISPNSEYATFSTDGKAAGARFGSEKSDYFTTDNVEIIKEESIGRVAKNEPEETQSDNFEEITGTTTSEPTTTPEETQSDNFEEIADTTTPEETQPDNFEEIADTTTTEPITTPETETTTPEIESTSESEVMSVPDDTNDTVSNKKSSIIGLIIVGIIGAIGIIVVPVVVILLKKKRR